jgi:hypothetical protein
MLWLIQNLHMHGQFILRLQLAGVFECIMHINKLMQVCCVAGQYDLRSCAALWWCLHSLSTCCGQLLILLLCLLSGDGVAVVVS